MYNSSLATHSNNNSSFIATTFDDFAKKKKARGENRKSYYGNLVRPDGSPLSEKDCLLLDLCIQWTKEGKICTSTYAWLLKNKFPRQRHNRTVSRTFYNISRYIKANFKNSQIINGVVEKDKIKIERVADFDQKMIEEITKSEEQNNQNYSLKCQPSATQMSTMDDTNVNPSTYIYKKTIKITTDNHDNQFLNSKNFSSESVETKEAKIATSEIVENSESWLAREEYEVNTQRNIKTVEVKGKDGKTYNAPYLRDFPFTDKMLETAIFQSKKPHYTTGKVRAILEYVLEKKPNMQIYGGRGGFIKYLVKMINGEKDYEYAYKYPPSQEERAISMAEREDAEQIELAKRYELLFQGKIKSISQAENYYG